MAKVLPILLSVVHEAILVAASQHLLFKKIIISIVFILFKIQLLIERTKYPT